MTADIDDLQTLRRSALAAHREGRFLDAVQTQIEVINRAGRPPAEALDDHKRLGLFMFSLGDLASAAKVLEHVLPHAAGDDEVVVNLAVVYKRLGRNEEAATLLERAIASGTASANAFDGLAAAYGNLGRLEDARAAGTRSLALKDAEVADVRPWPLPAEPPPPFDPAQDARNVIAFSLWGDREPYLEGALRNVEAAPHVYPGWRLRFYVDDSVPAATLRVLAEGGAEIVRRPAPRTFWEGLLWRFEAAADPAVRRFLVRDVDSVLNVRERVAVDAWLDSGRCFHVMRDYFTHSDPMLAGMWGGVGGLLPPVSVWLEAFRTGTAPTRNHDQLLLRMVVWPTVKRSVLVHDSFFDHPPRERFPALGRLPPWAHVGQGAPWRFGPE